jgi:diguanylate cyclase
MADSHNKPHPAALAAVMRAGVTPQAVYQARLGFARRSYMARTGGLGAAFIMFAAVMSEKDASFWVWFGPTLFCLAWPPLAWWMARESPNPRDLERRNLLTDQFLVGIWLAPMEFSLLPCVLALAMTSMNTVAGGGWRLLVRGLMLLAAGLGLGILVYGFRWHPHTSLLGMAGSIPLLIFQPVAVGYVAHAAITSLNRKRCELERLSQHDGLSGLYNRLYWDQLARQEFARFKRSDEPVVLVMADLDHFKRINDSFGHAAGDEAIRRLAASFRRVLRESDICGRYGGEEFVVVLPNTGVEAAREVIERLRLDMQQHPLLDEVLVTASFGMAGLTRDIGSVEEWVRLADHMLYEAKHRGRDQVVDVSEVTSTGMGRLEILNA